MVDLKVEIKPTFRIECCHSEDGLDILSTNLSSGGLVMEVYCHGCCKSFTITITVGQEVLVCVQAREYTTGEAKVI